MAATMALQLRPKHRPFRNRFIQFFSSSTSDPDVEDQKNNSSPPSQSQPSFSSYFSDVKASLKQESPQPRQPRKPFSFSSTPSSSPNPSKVASLEEIRKNLTEFRRRTAASPHDDHISFQDLYKRNVIPKDEESNSETSQGGKLSFDAIRRSLQQLRSNAAQNQAQGGGTGNESLSLSKYQQTLKLRPADPNGKNSTFVIGGTDKLPASVFGKEMREKKEAKSAAMKTEFVKMYSYGELGEKLRMLRPEGKGGNWFSLGELNERLMKLREFEEKETNSRIGGVAFKDLRESLLTLKMSENDKAKRSSLQKLNVLSQLGGTPNFMLAPPKEQLIEKYFHPDNMSSSEKMKVELKKVRDEFKMSESDCGSARVQVAQLTTKIKHLSTALHKKDKHSRKGLQAMVQRRKKLLKYLRRTDWDSYCFVLSKLGLRDNPDYKN
ncbi:hypothetical protein F0562_023116 [Nyssa sinensis]|uniref:Small ribosomal subunit protein uS15c n=1 Tax=Nyssa sinensis TaxID=561372 RepID=A0A5J5BH21_9ASTE|nr:hypothetical protein F0562_023116 [Nyssa sinensis]